MNKEESKTLQLGLRAMQAIMIPAFVLQLELRRISYLLLVMRPGMRPRPLQTAQFLGPFQSSFFLRSKFPQFSSFTLQDLFLGFSVLPTRLDFFAGRQTFEFAPFLL